MRGHAHLRAPQQVFTGGIHHSMGFITAWVFQSHAFATMHAEDKVWVKSRQVILPDPLVRFVPDLVAFACAERTLWSKCVRTPTLSYPDSSSQTLEMGRSLHVSETRSASFAFKKCNSAI